MQLTSAALPSLLCNEYMQRAAVAGAVQGADSVTGYFPRGAWHALWNGSTDVDASKGGRHVALSTPLGESNVHVRAGSIVPLQRPALTTAAVRASPVALLVALPSSLQVS